MKNGAVQWSLLPQLLLASCGGTEIAGLVHLEPNAKYAVQVVRDQIHPAYRCDGTIDTGPNLADFSCVAENFAPWTVQGAVEHFELAGVVRLWIRQAGVRQKVQPDIAIDMEPRGDRFSGWGTILLQDGTEAGHSGATAEAVRIDASADGG